MTEECDKCGKEFDTERGLHIHQTQKHENQEEQEQDKQESSEEEEETKKVEESDEKRSENKEDETTNQSGQGITLSTNQFGALTFATGLFLGLALGGIFSGLTLTPDSLGATQTDDGSSSDANLVEIGNTEYPYGDLEAGIGSGEKTYGNTTINVDGEPYIGSQDAEVTAVSYEDFECPFCKRYHEGAYPQIIDNYVRSGDVQYFYKNLPLPQLGHDWAEPSAIASECVLNQDPETFWTFKQAFFANQEKLTDAKENGAFDETMYKWADETGLDQEQFKQCYDNNEESDEVNQDRQEAGENGAEGTPSILINGKVIAGAQPYPRFQTTIESALE